MDQLGKARLANQVVPYLCADKPGRTTEGRDKPHNPGFQHKEIKPQNLWLLKLGGIDLAVETPSLTGEFTGGTHRVLEHTHPVISTRKAQFAGR